MYVVVMTYPWIGRLWIYLYICGIIVLQIFTFLLGGAPLCIPQRLYNGTPLGETTWGTLEGYPGRVLLPRPFRNLSR